MEVMTEIENISLFSVWILGISVGLTVCTMTCLPFIGSWVISKGEGAKSALWDSVYFVMGKVFAYTTLGTAAGWLGNMLLLYLKSGVGNFLIGVASLLAGWWLIFINKENSGCSQKHNRKQNLHPFLLGYSLSFIPCAPLAALLAACALAGSLWQGMLHGFVFGIGASITPLFIILPLLGGFGKQLHYRQPWIKKWLLWVGGLVLMMIGSYRVSLSL